MENQKFCQSCAMPIGGSDETYGTEADGSRNHDYCQYCYVEGKFPMDITMEQMIDFCAPYMLEQYKDEQQAKAAMLEFFPKLKRWAAQG